MEEFLRRSGVDERVVAQAGKRFHAMVSKSKKKDSCASSVSGSSTSGESLKRAPIKSVEEQPPRKRGRPKKGVGK